MLEAARRDLKALKGSRIALKLLTVIAVGRGHDLCSVSSLYDVTRQSVSRWIVSYRKSGIEGLQDVPKGHRKPRLTPSAVKTVTDWVKNRVDADGKPIHWTIEKLRLVVSSHFGVTISNTRIWQILHAEGFRLKVPRPRHIAADPQKQEEFKKN
jgi:transposase